MSDQFVTLHKGVLTSKQIILIHPLGGTLFCFMPLLKLLKPSFTVFGIQDDFLTGTPDAILSDYLIDVKNSWDCYSFPLFFDAIPNKAYYYQAQGYMALTGLDNYKLIYTLMDTPDELIEREYKFSSADNYDLFCQHYKYSNIDSKYRIKVFNIERDNEVIESIYKRVIDCRMYIKFELNK